MEQISSSGKNSLSVIKALVLSETAVGLLFVDFGDEVWKSSDVKMSHEG